MCPFPGPHPYKSTPDRASWIDTVQRESAWRWVGKSAVGMMGAEPSGRTQRNNVLGLDFVTLLSNEKSNMGATLLSIWHWAALHRPTSPILAQLQEWILRIYISTWNLAGPCRAPGHGNLSVSPISFLVGNRPQPPWPSLSSTGQVQTVANQGREGMQRQGSSSQKTIV